MPETNAIPTDAEIKAIRSDVADYLINGKTTANHAASALAQFKIDLEDLREIQFSWIFDSTADAYYADADGNTRNDQKCIWMLCHLTISKIFRDYAIKQSVSTWWDLANEYETRYHDRLKTTKLDVDLSENGTITTDETAMRPQAFSRS